MAPDCSAIAAVNDISYTCVRKSAEGINREMMYQTQSAPETFEAGKTLAKTLRSGDIVALHGGLGAGKTVFAKGIAAGLGIEDDVVSPTFTLLKTYDGDMRMRHFDLYRIEDEEELLHIGFYEALEDAGISVIEWPDHAAHLPVCINVRLTGSGSDERIIEMERPEET